VLAATLVAAMLRFYRLGAQSLWIDEVLTWYSANLRGPLSLGDLLENVHGPLHALAVHVAGGCAGDTEWALRLPSALCGVATVPAMAWLSDRWLGRASAGWAAWATALSPFMVWYSQEARPYAMMMLMVCVSSALLLDLARRRTRGLGAAYLATAAAGLLSHPAFAFVLPLQLKWWLGGADDPPPAIPPGGPAPRAARVPGALLAALLLGAVVLPWAPQVARTWDWQRLHPGRAAPAEETRLRGVTTFHVAAVPFTLHAFAVGYTLGPSLRELRADPSRATLARHAGELSFTTLVFGALGVLGVIALRRRRRLGDAVLWCGVPVLVVSWFALSNFKVFHPRYLAAASPALLLAWSAALTDLRPRPRWWLAAAAAALWAAALLNHYGNPRYGKEDVRGAARLVARRADGDERVIAVNAIDPMLYYYRGPAPLQAFWLGFAADSTRLAARLGGALAGAPGAWVVLSRPEDLDPGGRFARWMDEHYPEAERFPFEGVRVWHLRLDTGPRRRGRLESPNSEPTARGA
jgi:hypothetical protein